MDGFIGLLKVVAIGFFALAALFIVLLALPASRLRSFVLEFLGWGTAGVSAASVVSPIDFVPDLIPVLGWMDDVGALCVGAASVILAFAMRRQRQALERADAERRPLRGA